MFFLPHWQIIWKIKNIHLNFFCHLPRNKTKHLMSFFLKKMLLDWVLWYFDWTQEEEILSKKSNFCSAGAFIHCACFHHADIVKVTKMACSFIQDLVDEETALICSLFLPYPHAVPFLNGSFLYIRDGKHISKATVCKAVRKVCFVVSWA